MITFDCANCGERLDSPQSEAGKGLICPKCKTFVRVPAASIPHAPHSTTTARSYGPEALGCFGTILIVVGVLCILLGFGQIVDEQGRGSHGVVGAVVFVGGWLMAGLGAIVKALRVLWRLLGRLSDRP